LEKHSSHSLEERLRRITAGDGIQLDMNSNVNSQIGLVGAAAMHDLHVIPGVIQGPKLRAMAVTKKHSLHSIHSWWKTQLLRKIESGPNYKTVAQAFA